MRESSYKVTEHSAPDASGLGADEWRQMYDAVLGTEVPPMLVRMLGRLCEITMPHGGLHSHNELVHPLMAYTIVYK